MSTSGFDFVNWDVVEMAMVGFPEMFHLWAAKHMSHFCSVGRMQLTCGFWDHSRCPQCQQKTTRPWRLKFCPMVTVQIKNG